MADAKDAATAAPVIMQMATKTHRPEAEIAADLAAATAELQRLEPVTRDQRLRRNAAQNRLLRARAAHAADPDNAGFPFDAELYPVPPEETPETKLYHDQHYVVARFEKELEAAKKAMGGQ